MKGRATNPPLLLWRNMPILIPPGQPTGAFHDGKRRWNGSDLWRFYGFSQGLAIVKIDGQWTTATVVNLDLVEEFYQGGMRHVIDGAKAAELTLAGFGAYISPDDGTHEDLGYGEGGYGSGMYGF